MEKIYINSPGDLQNKSDIEQSDTYEKLSLSKVKNVALPTRQETLSTQGTDLSGQNTKRFDVTWCRIVVIILVLSTFFMIIQTVVTVVVIQSLIKDDGQSGVTLTFTETTTQENIKNQVCGQPPYVAHSQRILTGNTSGTMIMYFCNKGYNLDGIPAVFCQSDGQWSRVQFSCKRDCGHPPNIPFARTYFNSKHVGSIAKYECVSGLFEVGNPIFRCDVNGSWTSNRFECLNTQIRLVGGYNKTRGRVEINYFGVWGTVCDDDWEDVDALVVCKQLGYRTGIAKTSAYFGQGNGTIWMDNVNCTGSESRVEQCKFRGWGKEDCNHSEDAGVVCINA